MTAISHFTQEPLTTAQESTDPRYAFPAIGRVAGLPAQDLALATDALREILRDITYYEELLPGAADRVNEICYQLVPKTEEPALRRKVLAGKRAAHRQAPLPWNAEESLEITADLDGSARSAVEHYLQLHNNLQRLKDHLEDQVVTEREHAIEVLHTAVRRPGLAESLVLAAPDWIRYKRPQQKWLTTQKELKTLVSYVSRTAAKTSPFSGLTTVGRAGERGKGRALSRTSVEMGYRALQILARDFRTAGFFTYRPSPQVLVGDGLGGTKGLMLASELTAAGGAVWREDRVLEMDPTKSWHGLFDEDQGQGFDFAAVLDTIGGEEPFHRFVRLFDQGLIYVDPPWQRSEDPLMVLTLLLEEHKVTDAPISGSEMRLLAEGGQRAAGAGADQRLQDSIQMAESVSRLFEEMDAAKRHSGFVYEDRETELQVDDPTAAPETASALDRLGQRIRPSLFRTHVYDLMVDQFTQQFGEGGSTSNTLAFLMSLGMERDQNPLLQSAQAADMRSRQDPGARAWKPVGATSAPPHVGVMYQMAERSPAQSPLVVVNNLGSGTGSLYARFAQLLGEDFTNQLRAGVRQLWGNTAVHELTVWNDSNTAQAQCAGVLPPLRLPKEPSAPGGLGIEDTVLVHDPLTDTLNLTDRSGQPIGLAYLGLTPKHALHGYQRFLGVLADPWINASNDCDYTGTKIQDLMPLCGEDIVHLPRIQEGNLVIRRNSWIVPKRLLPGADAVGSEAELLRSAHRFRTEHGISEEIFVHQLAGFRPKMGTQHKPLWVSLASTTSVRVMHQVLEADTQHVRIVEALPERDQHLQRDDQGHRTAAEHITLMHWPTPGKERSS